MILKNLKDIEALKAAIKKCRGDVIIRSLDGKEEFSLKSTLSQYIAIGRLCEERGDEYEVFCMHKVDEVHLIDFFHNMSNRED